MTRSELYALVWDEPVSQLAERLGLSGKGLAKLCARHDIPVPPRGYRQKVEAGQKVEQPPLPPREADEVIPRFALRDANGSPLPTVEEEHWVIPGIVKGVRTVLAPEPSLSVTGTAEVLSASRTSTAPPLERIEAEDSTPILLPPAPPPRPRTRRPISGTEALSAADLERVISLGFAHQRHQAARELLSAVTVRALEDPTSTPTLLDWVASVKAQLDEEDPVAALISSVRARHPQ